MKNALQTVGIASRGRGMKALVPVLGLMALTAPAALAQSASGNAGADAIIDGIGELSPIIGVLIVACVGLGFLILASTLGYKLIRKFF